MALAAGDTFLLTGGPIPPHLWVVLWGPAGPANACLAVFLTTLRRHSDRSCILVAGDHPFIRHDTAVSYGNAQPFTEEKMDRLLATGTAKRRQPVSDEVLERIRTGFFASAHTPNAMIEMAVKDFGAMRPPNPDAEG